MPGAPDAWVLDTSALLCLKADEPGASGVDEVLREGGRHGKVFVSFMSLMEYYYIRQQTFGEVEARKGYLELKQLPIIVVESDEELGLMAAGIKATWRLSVADAWVAATAERLGAVLVHKDPEFEPLKGRIVLRSLPYKGSKSR